MSSPSKQRAGRGVSPAAVTSMSSSSPSSKQRARRGVSHAAIASWDEVAEKLLLSQKVSRKKIIESLEYAVSDILASPSPKARIFLKDHIVDIIDGVLEQRYDVIDKVARPKAETILRISLEIANWELANAEEDDYDSWVLDALASIFDKTKPYYCNSDHAELRIDQIEHFHGIGGFARLSSYISLHEDLESFFSTLRQLLGATFEAIFVTEEKEIDSANSISKAVMGHLGNLNGMSLADLPTSEIQQVCNALRRINRRLAFSDHQKLSDFHEFWRKLTLTLIHSGSAEHKSFGLKQVVALIDAAHVPKSYTLSGAGISFINGVYELAPSALLDDSCVGASSIISYERVVPANDPDVGARGKRLKLHPCVMMEAGLSFLSVWWFISEMDGNSETGTDYYFHKSTAQEKNGPDLTGWDCCGSAVGADPAPTLESQPASIPIGDECSNTLGAQLSSWMVQNKVFDTLLGEHSRFMETPTAMVDFLSRINSGNELNRVADRSAVDVVLGQRSRLLESIRPLLLADPSPPSLQPAAVAATSPAQSAMAQPTPNSEFFTAIGAAKQRLASAERWRRSTQNAMQEYLQASKEEQNARLYLAQLEISREVINVDDVDNGDATDGSEDKKQAKRPRRH